MMDEQQIINDTIDRMESALLELLQESNRYGYLDAYDVIATAILLRGGFDEK